MCISFDVIHKIRPIARTNHNHQTLSSLNYPIAICSPRNGSFFPCLIDFRKKARFKTNCNESVTVLKILNVSIYSNDFLEFQSAVKYSSQDNVSSTQDHILIKQIFFRRNFAQKNILWKFSP